MMSDFNAIMFLILGVFLSVRFVNSFEGKNRTYSARTLLINFVMFVLYILSIPEVWR